MSKYQLVSTILVLLILGLLNGISGCRLKQKEQHSIAPAKSNEIFDSTVFLENEKRAEWLDQYYTILANSVKECPGNIRSNTNTGSFFCYQTGKFWRSYRFEKKESKYEITHDLVFDNNMQLLFLHTVDDPSLYSNYEKTYNAAKTLTPTNYELYFYPDSANSFTVYAFPSFDIYDLSAKREPTYFVKIDRSGIAMLHNLPVSNCAHMGDLERHRRLSLFPDDLVQPTLFQHYFARHYSHVWDTVQVFLSHKMIKYTHSPTGLKFEIGPTTLYQ